MTTDDEELLSYSLEDFPHLNARANQAVRIEVASPSGPGRTDDGYVSLRVLDARSGTVLVDVQMDPGRFWRLLQGGVQTWPAFIGPHLDRVGKRMENRSVTLPPPVQGDIDRDTRRDVSRAVHDQLPEDWWDTWQSYDEPRENNRRQWSATVRRWVAR